MISVLLDANVIVSGLFWYGPPKRVYRAALDGRYIALSSQPLLDELRSVLGEEKFQARFAAADSSVEEVMTQIEAMIHRVIPAEIPSDAVRDPKDRAVLACAVGGKADFIVSGDKDLLVLTIYEGIPILNAAQFLERLPEP